MKTIVFGLALLGLGIIAGASMPGLSTTVRGLAGLTSVSADAGGAMKPGAHNHNAGGHAESGKEEAEGRIKLSAAQIEAARISVTPAGPGTLGIHVIVPGVVQPDPDRVARVAGRVVGTVAELRKRLGDTVEKGEVVAIIDSREVAEAKSEYVAARTNLELQQTLFEREQSLWDKRISAEMQFLRARTTLTETQLRGELAVQKLRALGLGEDEIGALERRTEAVRTASAAPDGGAPTKQVSVSGLQRYTVRSPMSGQIVERLVNLGAPMGGEGENKELYVVADLSIVWIELALPTGDLRSIRQGQSVTISSGDGLASHGRIVFVNPILNPETRSARVIASVDNDGMVWRPGSYVTAKVTTAEEKVDLRLPKAALQTVGGEQVVFVRTADGFEKREVATGKSDDAFVEIVFGLDPGEEVAVGNSFVLKAELGKAEAEHAH